MNAFLCLNWFEDVKIHLVYGIQFIEVKHDLAPKESIE